MHLHKLTEKETALLKRMLDAEERHIRNERALCNRFAQLERKYGVQNDFRSSPVEQAVEEAASVLDGLRYKMIPA